MPRGLGQNNMSEAELKEAKAERDKTYYFNNRDEIRRKNALKLLNATILTCPCGGTYKDYKGSKYSHGTTHGHQLWLEETERGLVPLVCKKIKKVNNNEEARQFINNHYMANNKFSAIQKECYLPTFINKLKKLEDKPPPPPPVKKVKLKIKKKLNIVKPDTN
tara:strand:- start:165 stop:653 length:489 start_codon:yes stop_codon:yes gene_type:complete